MKTRTKVLLSLAAASLLLAGCEALRGRDHEDGKPMMQLVCGDPVCRVTVTVSNCGIGDPGRLYVTRKGQVQIIWNLSAGDHDFTDNGITFSSGPFTRGNPAHPRKGVYVMHDNYDKPGGPYKYTIEVKKDGGGTCRKDPDVVNDNPSGGTGM